MNKSPKLSEESISKKRKFWVVVFWAGVGFFVVTAMMASARYTSSIRELKDTADSLSSLEAEIMLVTKRRTELMVALKWFIPFAIVASVWINLARYRMRRLKKLAQKAMFE